MKPTLTIILACLALCACTSSKKLNRSANIETDKVYIVQNGWQTEVGNKMKSIELEKEAFSIRFLSKPYNSEKKEYYAAGLVAITDEAELHKISTGMQENETAYFELGSGLAAHKSTGYEGELFIDAIGQHYLYYENESSKRVNLLKKMDELLLLEFDVERFNRNEKTTVISESTLNELHLIIYIDRNLNEVIDKGELYKMTVRFV